MPRNVKLLGGARLWNDIASEKIFPWMPLFLLTALGRNRFYLAIIDGLAESVLSFLLLRPGELRTLFLLTLAPPGLRRLVRKKY